MPRLLIITLAFGAAQIADTHRVKFQEAISSQSQCPAEISQPAGGKSVQQHFDGQRAELGLVSPSEAFGGLGNPETCTTQDVCLLMRQLDMDFYQRARAGTLTDHDFDTPPEMNWLRAGSCKSQTMTTGRGKRFKTVTDCETCMDKATADGVAASVVRNESLTIDNAEYPSGCVLVVDRVKGTTELFMNTADTDATAGSKKSGSIGMSRWEVDKDVSVLCEHDRSLSETGATYYSPYKLKPSMIDRPEMSTSCSFGMMAVLAKLQETKSSCAKILTYKTSGRFKNAQEALDAASQLDEEGAAKIREYVEQVRQKYVLIDTIANRWCPGVWKDAITSGGTCSVSRELPLAAPKKSVTSKEKKKSGGGRMGNAGLTSVAGNSATLNEVNTMKLVLESDDDIADQLFGDAVEKDGNLVAMANSDLMGKPAKHALSEDICMNLESQTLAEVLEAVSEIPPDAFRDADIDRVGAVPVVSVSLLP